MKKILSCILLLIWTGGVLFLTQYLLSFPFAAIVKNSDLSSLALIQTLYSTASYLVSFIIVVFVPYWLGKRFKKLQEKSPLNIKNPRADLGLLGLPTWADLGLAPVTFIIYMIFAGLITSLFTYVFPWFNATEAQEIGYSKFLSGPDLALAFFSLVILAPIAEELIFRGYLYGKIKSVFYKEPTPTKKSIAEKSAAIKSLKSPKKAELIAIIISTLLTSLLFGFMHLQWNVGVNVFVMSVFLCLLREITGSTYSGILVHVIKNLIAFYILFIANGGF